MPNLLREYINQHITSTQKYRSQFIEEYGQEVEMIRPVAGSTNVYGDESAVDTAKIVLIPLLINWEEYTRLLEFDTGSTHENVPLTASARLEDNIPVGSLMRIEVMIVGISSVQVVTFRVTKLPIKINLHQHSKELTLTPHRGGPAWR